MSISDCGFVLCSDKENGANERINLFYQDLRFGQVIKNSIGVAAISSSINLGMQALGEHKYHCD